MTHQKPYVPLKIEKAQGTDEILDRRDRQVGTPQQAIEAGRSLEDVPTCWLVETLKLMDRMAGASLSVEDCADPADLMTEIADYLGISARDAEELWIAAQMKFQNAP